MPSKAFVGNTRLFKFFLKKRLDVHFSKVLSLKIRQNYQEK